MYADGEIRPGRALASIVLLALTSCGPGQPGAGTPILPPATVWQVHTEAGDEAMARGDVVEAERHYLAALQEAQRLKVASPREPDKMVAQDPAVVASLNKLGLFYLHTANYEQADTWLSQALVVSQKNLGPEHPYVAVTLQNRAKLCRAQGNLTEAESLLRKALVIDERALGSAHPKLGYDLNQLGEVAAEQDQVTEAEAYFTRGLSIREGTLGPDHPDVADSLTSMARFYMHRDMNMEAEDLYRRALAIREKQLGPENPAVAETLDSYAELLRKTKRMELARAMEERARIIRVRIREGGNVSAL